MNKKFIIFTLFLLLIVFLTGCKSKRTILKEPLKEYGTEYLLEKMKENEFKFKTLSLKASINTKINRKKSSLSATLRIHCDSMMWISITPGMGIEAARILITQDSVFFMNRINKEYFVSDFSSFTERVKMDLDFNMLQSLLLGSDFSYYNYDNFKSAFDAGNYRLSTSGRSKLKKYIRNNSDAQRILVQNVWLEPENFKINQIKFRGLYDETIKFEASYDEFENNADQLLTTNVIFNILVKGNSFADANSLKKNSENKKINLKLTFSKIVLNEDVSMPFTIPAKYLKINL